MYFRGLAAAASSVALSARALPVLCQLMFQADSSKVAATEAMRAPIASGPPRLGFSPPGRGAFRPRRCALVSPRRPLLRKGSLGFRARGGPGILTWKGGAEDSRLPLHVYLVVHVTLVSLVHAQISSRCRSLDDCAAYTALCSSSPLYVLPVACIQPV